MGDCGTRVGVGCEPLGHDELARLNEFGDAVRKRAANVDRKAHFFNSHLHSPFHVRPRIILAGLESRRG